MPGNPESIVRSVGSSGDQPWPESWAGWPVGPGRTDTWGGWGMLVGGEGRGTMFHPFSVNGKQFEKESSLQTRSSGPIAFGVS